MEKFKEIFNFDNISGKIKTLAKVLCSIGIIVSVIAGIVVMCIEYMDAYLILPGLLIIIVGSLLSWVSSFFTYAFGELVERAISIDSRLYYLGKELAPKTEAPDSKPQSEEITTNETVANGNPSRVNTPEQLGTCEMCEKENVAVFECCYENQYGRFYREMCSDCIEKHNAKRV